MIGWRDEDKYDPEIHLAVRRYPVPPWLIKSVIGAESGFNPLAVKREDPRDTLPPTPDFPKGGDESRGLMQVLVRTARALNFAGDKDGLYNPSVNIDLGTRLLRDNLIRSGGKLDVALSAYNGGWAGAGSTDGRRVAGPGSPFTNQDYVDRVLQYANYFRSKDPSGPTGQEKDQYGRVGVAITGGGGMNPMWVLGVLVVVSGVVWYMKAQRSGRRSRR